jgi:hypothetical protein
MSLVKRFVAAGLATLILFALHAEPAARGHARKTGRCEIA